MPTPEKKVKAAIKKLLFAMDCWYYMPVPSGYGEATLDFLCSYKGRSFAVEAKAHGKTLSLRQQITIKTMSSRGVPCIMIDSASDDSMMCLRAWILMVGEGNFVVDEVLVAPPPMNDGVYDMRAGVSKVLFGDLLTDIEKIKDE